MFDRSFPGNRYLEELVLDSGISCADLIYMNSLSLPGAKMKQNNPEVILIHFGNKKADDLNDLKKLKQTFPASGYILVADEEAAELIKLANETGIQVVLGKKILTPAYCVIVLWQN